MSVGFARYLYVPEDGTRYSSSVATSIEDALRDAGLAVGPEGDGRTWRPFRPTGALKAYAEELGLVYPTLKVEWYDDPHRVTDPFLPPRGPWSRCGTCRKLLPTNGMVFVNDELTELDACPSCGASFDAYGWERADDRTVFESRLVVSLTADGYARTLPAFEDGCPHFVSCVREILDTPLRDVFVAW